MEITDWLASQNAWCQLIREPLTMESPDWTGPNNGAFWFESRSQWSILIGRSVIMKPSDWSSNLNAAIWLVGPLQWNNLIGGPLRMEPTQWEVPQNRAIWFVTHSQWSHLICDPFTMKPFDLWAIHNGAIWFADPLEGTIWLLGPLQRTHLIDGPLTMKSNDCDPRRDLPFKSSGKGVTMTLLPDRLGRGLTNGPPSRLRRILYEGVTKTGFQIEWKGDTMTLLLYLTRWKGVHHDPWLWVRGESPWPSTTLSEMRVTLTLLHTNWEEGHQYHEWPFSTLSGRWVTITLLPGESPWPSSKRTTSPRLSWFSAKSLFSSVETLFIRLRK